jgi:hypothetical protein
MQATREGAAFGTRYVKLSELILTLAHMARFRRFHCKARVSTSIP